MNEQCRLQAEQLFLTFQGFLLMWWMQYRQFPLLMFIKHLCQEWLEKTLAVAEQLVLDCAQMHQQDQKHRDRSQSL
jgi:hypothetical protein